MEDVYMNVSRLVFVLLESLSIIDSTKNIETLISRYHLVLEINSELCKLSDSESYMCQVKLGVENYKAHFFDKVLTDLHTHLVTYPCQPYLRVLCCGALLRCFGNHYAEQVVAVNLLKSKGAKIKRLRKLCALADEVKKEITAIEFIDQKGILNADEALKTIDKVKRQVEADIKNILKTSRNK